MGYDQIFNKMVKIYNSGHHKERGLSLYKTIKDVIENSIPGDFVECGVASGKSSCIGLLTMLSLNDNSKDIWLYDTYEGVEGQKGGFDKPLERDIAHNGKSAIEEWETGNLSRFEYEVSDVWVKNKLLQTGYPEEKIKIIKGKVEDTIPQHTPKEISILRLDTDFYLSTKHELEHLYPLLSEGGYLLLDDYGHWNGCKEAVHEYFGGKPEKAFMGDYTLLVYKKESK